jgi:pyruvate-formate lyase-activating enzyme
LKTKRDATQIVDFAKKSNIYLQVVTNGLDKASKTAKKLAKREAFLNDLKTIGNDCRDIKNGKNKKVYQSMQSFLDGI